MVERISERVGRHLERRGPLIRDADSAYLDWDEDQASTLDDLAGHSITYRVAVGIDDALDLVVQTKRKNDNAYGLALCRAGTWFDWIGAGHPITDDDVVAHTVAALEAWSVVDPDRGPFGFDQEPAWPALSGQGLVLERLEKSMVMLYWDGSALQAHKVFRMVEPGPE